MHPTVRCVLRAAVLALSAANIAGLWLWQQDDFALAWPELDDNEFCLPSPARLHAKMMPAPAAAYTYASFSVAASTSSFTTPALLSSAALLWLLL